MAMSGSTVHRQTATFYPRFVKVILRVAQKITHYQIINLKLANEIRFLREIKVSIKHS